MNVLRAIVVVATVSVLLCLLPHYLGFAGLLVGTGIGEIGPDHVLFGVDLVHNTVLCLVPTTAVGAVIALVVEVADRTG